MPDNRPFKVFLAVLAATVGLFVVLKCLPRRGDAHGLAYLDGNPATPRPSAPAVRLTPHSAGFDGPVVRTGDRVEELLGLAVACLVVRLDGRERDDPPRDVADLLGRLKAGNLLPPGASVAGGFIDTPSATAAVRFRLDPQGVELISIPKHPQLGPPLLLRSPGFPVGRDPDQAAAFALFSWLRPGKPVVPPPFGAESDLCLVGWTPQPVKDSPFPEKEAADLERWIDSARRRAR